MAESLLKPLISTLKDESYKFNNINDIDANDILDVEVGDTKELIFFPRMKLKKWDNEGNFSIGLIDKDPHIGSTKRVEPGLIEWQKGDFKINWYWTDNPYPDHFIRKDSFLYPIRLPENGSYEFDILIRKKPDTNVILLSINAKDLDFYYQPPLTEEEILSGRFKRPINVEGSYSVYHKTKRDHLPKGINYRVGKAFQIYRPRIVDFKGNFTWGSIEIDKVNQKMMLTIPQGFINNATYPILVDPTFGDSGIGSSTGSFVDEINASKFLGSNGTALSMTAYTELDNHSIKCAIYNFSTLALLTNAETDELTSQSGLAWRTMPFSTPPTISSTNYYLALWADGSDKDTNDFYYDAVAGGARDIESYGSWPDPLSVTTQNTRISIFATYNLVEEISDDFNRSNSDSLGGDWDEVTGDWDIVSNKAESTFSNSYALHQTQPSDKDQYVQAVLDRTGAEDANGFILRSELADNYDDCYLVYFRYNNNDVIILRNDAGSFDTVLDSATFTHSPGDTYRVEVETTDASTVQIRCYVNNVLVITADDTDAERKDANGYVGMFGEDGVTQDDFAAGIIAAASASSIKKLIGVAQASLKKVIGVANASIKKIAGVAN